MKYSFLRLAACILLAFFQNVGADILITKLDDVIISTPANLARDLIVTERLCVASDPVGVYGIIALGSGNNGSFAITNGPYEINYKVSYRDRRSSNRFIQLEPNVPVSGFLTRPLRNSRNCQGNAGRLRIIISKEELNRAVGGRYQGVVQLTVIPE